MANKLLRCALFSSRPHATFTPGLLARTTNLLPQSSGIHTTAVVCGGRKKSFWRQNKRHPAHTRLRPDKPERTKVRKAFGGHEKIKAMRANKGLYEWNSKEIQLETPILQVVESNAHKDFARQGIMVKGTVVKIEAKAFNDWLETHQQQGQDGEIQVEPNISQQLSSGTLYAKITSRPGQVGACNGYILEGMELEKFVGRPGFQDQLVSSAKKLPATEEG